MRVVANVVCLARLTLGRRQALCVAVALVALTSCSPGTIDVACPYPGRCRGHDVNGESGS